MIDFFIELYNLQNLDPEDRDQYAQDASQQLFKFYASKQYKKIPRTLTMLNLIINESEKRGMVSLMPLGKLKKGYKVTLDVSLKSSYSFRSR